MQHDQIDRVVRFDRRERIPAQQQEIRDLFRLDRAVETVDPECARSFNGCARKQSIERHAFPGKAREF